MTTYTYLSSLGDGTEWAQSKAFHLLTEKRMERETAYSQIGRLHVLLGRERKRARCMSWALAVLALLCCALACMVIWLVMR